MVKLAISQRSVRSQDVSGPLENELSELYRIESFPLLHYIVPRDAEGCDRIRPTAGRRPEAHQQAAGRPEARPAAAGGQKPDQQHQGGQKPISRSRVAAQQKPGQQGGQSAAKFSLPDGFVTGVPRCGRTPGGKKGELNSSPFLICAWRRRPNSSLPNLRPVRPPAGPHEFRAAPGP